MIVNNVLTCGSGGGGGGSVIYDIRLDDHHRREVGHEPVLRRTVGEKWYIKITRICLYNDKRYFSINCVVIVLQSKTKQ